MRLVVVGLVVAGCGSTPHPGTGDDDAQQPDGMVTPDPDAAVPLALGTVINVVDRACPPTAPAGSTCKQLRVTGCPGIENDPIDAVIAIRAEGATRIGTVVHFSGGGGRGFQGATSQAYIDAGYRDVHVAWLSDWQQTAASGIKTAGCRPATLLRWAFDDPAIHGGSLATAFCGEGFSSGSGQLGYALANYGLGDYLDYVNSLAGPPFGRIDLGCDGDAPPTATVCGKAVTTRLPAVLNSWENIDAPLACGQAAVPSAELERWKNDSISISGTYSYPKTAVQFFACINQPSAVTALGHQYFELVAGTEGNDTTLADYHCYTAADGCSGESLGATGDQDAIVALLAGCTPRH